MKPQTRDAKTRRAGLHHRIIEIRLVPSAISKWCLSTRTIFTVVLPAMGTELLITSVTTKDPRSICHLAL